MKSKFVKTTMLGILSLQNLAQAAYPTTNSPNEPIGYDQNFTPMSRELAEKIIQKRLMGFDPKQAVETLTYLHIQGVPRFESDGSVFVKETMIPDIMEVAEIDGLKVRILEAEENIFRIKFLAPTKNYDRSKIQRARKMACRYDIACDMDGKD